MTSKSEQYAEKAAEQLRRVEQRQRHGNKAPCEWATSVLGEAQANALLAIYWQKKEEKDEDA